MAALTDREKNEIHQKLNQLTLKTLDESNMDIETQADITQIFLRGFNDIMRNLPDSAWKTKLQEHYLGYFYGLMRLYALEKESKTFCLSDLLGTPPNYLLPVPLVYHEAKKILLHPFRLPLQYHLQPKIQETLRKYPRTALTATSVLFALNPSIPTLGLSLFTSLTCFFPGSRTQHLGSHLFQTGLQMALFGLVQTILFPLVFKAFVNQEIPLPLPALLKLTGMLLLQFCLEMRTAWNFRQFEAGNSVAINASYKRLARQVAQETFSPLKTPVLLGMGLSAGLLFSPESVWLKSITSLSKIIFILNSAERAFKKRTPEDIAYLALMMYSESLKILPSLSPASCLEIQTLEFFGVRLLTIPFPDSEYSPSCHEFSGLTWIAQRNESSLTSIFTADSLRHGDRLFASSEGLNDTLQSLIPWRSEVDPVQHFCTVVAPEVCFPSSLKNVRGILPGVRFMAMKTAEILRDFFEPEAITTPEQIQTVTNFALPLFLGYRVYQVRNSSTHPE